MAKIAGFSLQKKNTNRLVERELTGREKQEAQKLAYTFFEERGYQHGFDQEDWLRAEGIIRSRRS